MKGTYLGEFEELILLTVASITDNAYAVPIKSEVEKIANRKVNISAVHSSLYRLEDKGFLSSAFGGATSQRGGKSKRYFKVTNTGMEALKEAKQLREQFWRRIPQLSFAKI